MAKLIVAGSTILGVASLAGAGVELDPRSTDFGKIKIGNTRWDLWGGFQQYIRLFAQLFAGQTKSSTSGKINDLDGKGFNQSRMDRVSAFFRGKLAPVPATVVDVLSGQTATGDKPTVKNEVLDKFIPMLYNDIQDAAKDQGMKAILTVGIPSTFGVGVSTYEPNKKGSGGGAGASRNYRKTTRTHTNRNKRN